MRYRQRRAEMTYEISVIIPTFERCASVKRLLRALATQTLSPLAYEVIVSIDGSTDGTYETVSSLTVPYQLHVIWQPNNGRAAARNAGLRLASGPFIIFLDDDMEPVPEFLEAHLEAQRSDARLGVLGAIPAVIDPGAPPVARYQAARFERHLKKLATPGYHITIRDFFSGNFSIPRAVLEEVGGFNEAFKVYGNEDTELCVRLLNSGVLLVYNEHAIAREHQMKDIAALARDAFFQGQTAVQLARMHVLAETDFKLVGTFRSRTWKWRSLRGILLGLSKLIPRLRHVVLLGVRMVERRQPTRVYTAYEFAFDYCFWQGVQAALPAGWSLGHRLDEFVARESLSNDPA